MCAMHLDMEISYVVAIDIAVDVSDASAGGGSEFTRRAGKIMRSSVGEVLVAGHIGICVDRAEVQLVATLEVGGYSTIRNRRAVEYEMIGAMSP
jgi:hypothetical protein